MEEESLTRIPAHSNARRVNYRQASLVTGIFERGRNEVRTGVLPAISREFGDCS